jgi:sortase A
MTAMGPESGPPPRNRIRRRALVAAVTALLLVAVGGTYALVANGRDDADEATAATVTEPVATVAATTPPTSTTSGTSTSTTMSTATSTTASVPTTAATPTLPAEATQPIAPPEDERAPEDLGQLGTIAIPKVGLDASLHEGIRLTTLDRGPGHWPGSAMPGQLGNVVVAGHRTSHHADFRDIDDLVPGDLVTFTTPDGVFDYAVTSTEIVDPDAIWIIDPSETATATLFACHPPGSTRQRIVVHLALV